MKRNLFFFMLGCTAAACALEPLHPQEITLYRGWNAFFLKVDPQTTAEEFFADWPVSYVGRYDAAAYARTAQYSAAASTEGAMPQSVLLWRKDAPVANQWSTMAANMVYLTYSTNDTAFSRRVYGVPEAMRLSWHASTETALNYVGFSLDPEDAEGVRQSVYFAGFPAWKDKGCSVAGDSVTKQETELVFDGDLFKDGDVLAMGASAVSDWSGPLFVSPQKGIDLGTNGVQAAAHCRNDHSTNVTVRVAFKRGAQPKGIEVRPPLTTNFWVREDANVGTQSVWRAFTPEAPFEKELKPGETLDLQFAFNRTAGSGAAPGETVGGLVTFTDVSAGTRFQTAIPLTATHAPDSPAAQWPAGLWLAEVSFDQVSYCQAATGFTEPIPAGGVMKVRLPVYVAADGMVTLRPRVDFNGRRITSVFLPADLNPNYIAASRGIFGKDTVFRFTVDERSRSNPFLHARHPDHDGLDATFAAAAPSGDVADNYKAAVKPELFSIDNTITLTWSEDGTMPEWHPGEKLTGTCEWELGRLRREGNLKVRGAFVMKRLGSVTLESPVARQDDEPKESPEEKEEE